jgi:hypothetical protein
MPPWNYGFYVCTLPLLIRASEPLLTGRNEDNIFFHVSALATIFSRKSSPHSYHDKGSLHTVFQVSFCASVNIIGTDLVYVFQPQMLQYSAHTCFPNSQSDWHFFDSHTSALQNLTVNTLHIVMCLCGVRTIPHNGVPTFTGDLRPTLSALWSITKYPYIFYSLLWMHPTVSQHNNSIRAAAFYEHSMRQPFWRCVMTAMCARKGWIKFE